jgi:filamentous hemagglutinin family protein
MNRSYRLIWNRARQCWNVTSELTRARGKCGARAARVLGASLLLGAGGVQAGLPEGGTVSAGSGSISQGGNTLVVEQHSQRLVTEWQSFSVGEGHRVEFRQPGADAAALARVLGRDVSVIRGALSANGQLFLVNPNGVLFAPGAEVSVGSLVASTLDIRTEDFMAGNYAFAGDSRGLVINRGNIRAADGGLVALIAAQVENVGTIDMAGGTVALAAGSRVRVDMGGPIKVEVEAGAIDALVAQGGAIRAPGGRVYLTARAAGDLASSAINHGGLTMVSSLRSEGGMVRLEADRVNLAAASVVDASGGAQGGKIDVLGDHLLMATDALLDVSGDAGGGEILFGGNYLGLGPERNASTVTIAAGATLRADARVQGDGGRVIVWSDDRTEYGGLISARGGPNGGDGGFVETSSKRELIVTGRVSTAAPAGQAGAWLLDPEDVVIDSESADAESADGETATPEAGSFISAESVSEALSEGSGVTVYSTGSITANASLADAVESGQLTLLSATDAVSVDTLPGGGRVVRGEASDQASPT